MSRLAKGLLSPLAEDGESRHGVISTPLEADVFRNIPYNTHATQAIQSPFGRGPFPAPARTISSYRYSTPKALSLRISCELLEQFCCPRFSCPIVLPIHSKALPYTVTLAGQNSHTIRAIRADFRSLLTAGLASLVFMLLSLNMIPYAGIQEDEALFSIPFYSPLPDEYKIHTSNHDIPLMVMSYVGALKTWIYWPLVERFGPSVWTVRLPVALAGAVTIFIF